ncbi:unnamed protein product [Rotaria sp. Silwood1]|nr:unnamed protein product [Rotaria sp. Silwood1]
MLKYVIIAILLVTSSTSVSGSWKLLGLNISPQWLQPHEYESYADEILGLGPSIVRWNFNIDPFSGHVLDPVTWAPVDFQLRYVPLLNAFSARGIEVSIVLIVGRQQIDDAKHGHYSFDYLGKAYADTCAQITRDWLIPSGIRNVELGNEYNDDASWPDPYSNKMESAQQYMKMLKPAYTAVKSEYNKDGGYSHVMMMGLAMCDSDYLNALYLNGLQSYTDKINFHPYDFDETVDKIGPKINEMLTVMRRYGDGDKQIWLTEYGAQATPGNQFEMDNQTVFVHTSIRTMHVWTPQVQRAFWFNLQDFMNGDMPVQYGLKDLNFNRKPSYQAFIEQAAEGDS